MATFLLPYLVKVNIALILLYGFYRLFFQWDTFFQCKRFLLLSLFVVSLSYPFIDFSKELQQNGGGLAKVIAGNIPVFDLPEVIITSQPAGLWINLPNLLSAIYMIGVSLFFIWMLTQLILIARQIMRSKWKIRFGSPVCITEGKIPPFSFFHWILLGSEQEEEIDLHEILLHEKTHVRQYHTLDVLFCELMCIFCWFNPFVWLMKRDIRMNLEYLADWSVLNSGCDTEHYQLHLLRLSYHKAAATLSNNFNVSPLKKRIKMMNKRKTSWLGLSKYVLFVPLVAALLLINNTRITANVKLPESVSDVSSLITGLIENTQVASTQKKTPDSQQKGTVKLKQTVKFVPSAELDPSEPVIELIQVEKKPQFPGGKEALLEFLNKNTSSPIEDINEGVNGSVILRFVVNKSGRVDNIKVAKALSPGCDREAVRVVSKIPNWIPGELDGKPVNVYYNLPIYFQIQSAKQTESSDKK